MGTDITGWVEIKIQWDEEKSWADEGKVLDEPKWLGILPIWPLVGRNYEVFASLFGVRNRVGFIPIASERGLPADISNQAKKDFEASFDENATYGASWITWSEIKTIDWEEEPEEKKYLLISYSRNRSGQITSGTGQYYDSQIDIARQLGLHADAHGQYPWKEGGKWQKDGQTYEVQRLTRRTVLSKGWDIPFQLMEQVAESSANHDARLVAWFGA